MMNYGKAMPTRRRTGRLLALAKAQQAMMKADRRRYLPGA
jgi:hypothetical protein